MYIRKAKQNHLPSTQSFRFQMTMEGMGLVDNGIYALSKYRRLSSRLLGVFAVLNPPVY